MTHQEHVLLFSMPVYYQWVYSRHSSEQSPWLTVSGLDRAVQGCRVVALVVDAANEKGPWGCVVLRCCLTCIDASRGWQVTGLVSQLLTLPSF